MTFTGSRSASCKGVISQASHGNKLARVGSYPAATLAVGFFFVTCYVIFKDVFDGVPITPDHVMSFAVLVGTFASGHLLWGQLQQWRLLPALGLLVLFIAGTFYCVTASGGRNAAIQNIKAEEAHKSNDDRARIEVDLKQAQERLDDALTEEAHECASGEGPRCKGWRTTRDERQTYVRVLEARLELMKPRLENPELRHAAKLFAAFPSVTAKEDAIFAFLVLYFPFCKALFSEIATLVFGSIGFSGSHRLSRQPRNEIVTPTVAPNETVKPLKPKAANLPLKPSASVVPFHSKQAKQLQRDDALADLLSLGSVPSQETLAQRWNRSEATVSRWVRLWEAEGQIKRWQRGRCVSLGS